MFVPWREPIKLKLMRRQLLKKQEQEKRKQLQLKTVQKVVLIDFKVKSVLKMQRRFLSQKLQHVLVRLKSVRWGRRRVWGLLTGRIETVVWSTIPTVLMESKTLEVHVW